MNKHRIALNIAFTILMIASTFLPLANTQAAYPSAQIAKTNFGINQLPPFAPGVVLVGLKQGVTAGMGGTWCGDYQPIIKQGTCPIRRS